MEKYLNVFLPTLFKTKLNTLNDDKKKKMYNTTSLTSDFDAVEVLSKSVPGFGKPIPFLRLLDRFCGGLGTSKIVGTAVNFNLFQPSCL